MTSAVSHVRPVGTSRKRVSKVADARASLAGFGHGQEVDVLTFGQFSLIGRFPEPVMIGRTPTWTREQIDTWQANRPGRGRQLRG